MIFLVRPPRSSACICFNVILCCTEKCNLPKPVPVPSCNASWSQPSHSDNSICDSADYGSQEAWSEKVFMLCSKDFWLLFPYFRTLDHKMTPIRKSSIEPLLRYGNPDSQNLATLKNKIHIHRFLSFLSNNSGSDFMFRVALCLWITKTAHIWEP